MTVRPYKVLLLACVVNCTAGTPKSRLCPVVQWSVHWAPSRTTRFLVLAGARRCALETCGKKNARSSFRLGEIYLFILQIRVILARRDKIVTKVPPSQTYYECNRYEKPVKRKNKARSKAAPQEPFPLPPTLAQNH